MAENNTYKTWETDTKLNMSWFKVPNKNDNDCNHYYLLEDDYSGKLRWCILIFNSQNELFYFREHNSNKEDRDMCGWIKSSNFNNDFIFDINKSKISCVDSPKDPHYSSSVKDSHIFALKIDKLQNLLNNNPELKKYHQFDLYLQNDKNKASEGRIANHDENKEDEMQKQPKNQILYGPPGTGKTYNTVVETMRIIKPELIQYYEYNLEEKEEDKKHKIDEKVVNYEFLKDKFNTLKEQGRIEFVTFHQSYSYEEFVEGIKPVLNAENIQYEKKEGVFKQICEKASKTLVNNIDEELPLNDNPRVWKVSLAKTYENPIRTDCLQNNHIRIGWDEYGEEVDDSTDFKLYGGSRSLNAFIYKMSIGDIVLSCFSENTIDAIGIVTSEYKWNNELPDYKRVRDVKWLIKDIKHNILQINNNTKFTLGAVYELKNISLDKIFDIVNKNKQVVDFKQNDAPHVLIIDEINRGNISKIFGELITLIEEDKRLGEANEVTVKLPYAEEGEPAFGVPSNLYIIGTMNTSDRSIASVDIALRRRFQFKEMMPQANLVADFGCNFKEVFELLNKRISVLLDRDHQIGHSYFIEDKYKKAGVEELKEIWFDSIIPLLNEYFYGDWEKLQKLLGCAKDDGTSFIKKLDKIKFADDTTLDDEENCYDFVDKKEIKFAEAMAYAFKDVFKIEEQND